MKIRDAARKLMSHKEYEANLAGLNIVFGAMVGVVMGGIRDMGALDYSIFLILVASFVITLLYISASQQRLLYASIAGILLLLAWTNTAAAEAHFSIDPNLMEQRLLPVATVWFLFTIFVEFIPRGKPEPDSEP